MAYVYAHVRLDTNEVFYIGIGSDTNGKYIRAFHTGERNRNRFWLNIVSKTEYEVEILLDGITWEEACKKEIEYIALHKRRKEGGTLSNLTLGGEGQLGMCGELNGMYGKKTSEQAKLKQSLKKKGKPPPNKGKPMPKHQLDKLVRVNTGRPSWNKGLPASDDRKNKQRASITEWYKTHSGPNLGKKFSDESRKKMSDFWKGKPSWNKGKKMTAEYISKSCHVPRSNQKPVLQYDKNGNFIQEFVSTGRAAKAVGCRKSTITNAIKNSKTGLGFIWKRKDPEGS